MDAPLCHHRRAAGTTALIASPTVAGTYVYAWTPSGSAIAPTAVNVNTLTVSAAATATSAGSVTGLSVTSGKTLTVSNSLTLTATDGSTLAIGTGGTLASGAYAAAYSLPAQYTIQPCSASLWNAGSAITGGPYTIYAQCPNVYGVTYTVTHASVYSDNSGSSTCVVKNEAGNTMLSASTGAPTSWVNNADANISGTYYTIASGSHWVNFTITPDGTSTVIRCVLTTTR